MTCPDGQRLLHDHLDGTADVQALHQHLRDCPACAELAPAVRRLVRGVALLAPAEAPAGLGDRVADRLLREARARRRAHLQRAAALCGLAAAAALVLGVGLWAWWPVNGTPAPHAARPLPAEPDLAPPPLRDSMARAGDAVSTLTTRAAGDTAEQTASLWSLLPRAPMEAPPDAPAPDLSTLQEAGSGAGEALAPVTQSARRAVGLFLRDLPLRQTHDKKPG